MFETLIRNLYLLVFLFLLGCSQVISNEQEEDPREVRIAIAGKPDDIRTVTATGFVRYRRETPLSFTSDGRIARIALDEGDRFGKGRLLAALDTSTVDAALASAKADLQRIRADYERRKVLYAQGWVTRRDLEAAESEYLSAQAVVDSASFQTSNAKVFSPGPGVLLKRLAEPSQVVLAGQPVVMIGQTEDGLVLDASLSAREIAQISMGTPASVFLSIDDDTPVIARLVEIAEQSDTRTGMFSCLFLFPASARIRVGQVARVELSVPKEQVAGGLLPATALFDVQSDQGFVFVVDGENRAWLRKVIIESIDADGVSISEGVSAGDRVAVSGLDQLDDGVEIRPLVSGR